MRRDRTTTPNSLRKKAEAKLEKILEGVSSSVTEYDSSKLIHELEVLQLELEMQNEELNSAIAEAHVAAELSEFAPLGYFTLSPKGEILRTNLAGASMLGRERSRLKNFPLALCIPTETRPDFYRFLEKIFSSKTNESCNVVLLSGVNPPMHVYFTGIVTQTKESCLLTATDITERIQAEENLHKLNTRLQLAMQQANMAWWEMDIATGAVSFDVRKAEMLGYQPEMFAQYTDFMNLVHPDDYAKAMNAMRNYFNGSADRYEVEYRILAKSGDYQWFYDVGFILQRDINGKPLSVRGLVQDINARKNTEAALRESELKYRRLIENSSDAIVIYSKGKIELVNQSCLHLLQVNSAADVAGSKVLQFVQPGYRIDEFGTENLKSIENNVLPVYEEIFLRPDGSEVYVEVKAVPLKFENKPVVQLSIRDITGRKLAELELFRKDKLLEITGTTAKVGGWEFDVKTLHVVWTEEVYRIHEVDFSHNPSVKSGISFYTPACQIIIENALQRIIEEGVDYDLELEFITAKGNHRWVNSIGKCYRENGLTTKVYGSIQDITERKNMEAKIRESEAHYRLLTEEITDVVWRQDSQNRFTYVSPADERLRGFRADEVIGHHVFEFLPKEGVEFIQQKIQEWMQAKLVGKPNNEFTFEAQQKCKDGQWVWTEVRSTAERDADGNITGFHGISRDITKRKTAEDIKSARLRLIEFAKEHTVSELLQATLNELEVITDSRIGFFHFMEADQKTLSLQAYSTRTLSEMCSAKGQGRHYNIAEAGVWADCIRERRAIIHNNYKLLPNKKGMPEGHADIIRELVVPVIKGDNVMAILGVGNKLTDYASSDVETVTLFAEMAWDITERKQAEERIRLNEEKYRTLFENMTQGVFYRSADGSIFDINDAMINMLGLTHGQMLGSTPYHPDWKFINEEGQVLPPEMYPSMEALRSGKPVVDKIIGVFNPVQNQYRWLIMNANPQFLPNELTPFQVTVTAHDITQRKKAEEALIQSEATIRNKLNVILDPEGDISELNLRDIIDVDALQVMMEYFYQLTKTGIGILDMEGNVLVGVGWQDICTKFHRVNPETLANCLESDVELSLNGVTGSFNAYHCKNNLWDIMTPIVIGGRHFGNVCLGQFFYDDEIPDLEAFKHQAHRYGFDEGDYLSAVNHVSRFSKETVETTMAFYAKLADIISSLSYSTIKLSRAFAQTDLLAKQLKESELKYRTVADFTCDWEAWRAPDGTYRYVSPACQRITGYNADEFLNNPQFFVQIAHPDDRDMLIERYGKALREDLRQPDSFDFRIITSEEDVRWINHLSTPVFGENDEWLGRRESNRDISERKKTIHALQESEARFKNLFELHSAIMLLVDPETRLIVDANDAATRFYGFSKSELKLIKIDDLNVLSDEEVKIEREKARLVNLNYFIFKHKLADGEERTVEVHSSPIDFQEKQILFLIIHDITKRKLAEKEIQLKNEQLIKVIGEKDKFFSILAHDLRGPFNGFLGLTQIMAENISNITMEEVQQMAVGMKNSASNLFRLLENLLHWARFEQGLIPFNPKKISLLLAVNESLVVPLDQAHRKEIKIANLIPDDMEIYADIDMLQTIVRNLVSNAVKFTLSGGLITIDAKIKSKKLVEITVQDTGIGMSPAIKDNLFSIEIKTNRKGTSGELSTGLGLILCKEFIEKHGGDIRVESEVEKGSKFYVTFPGIEYRQDTDKV